MCDYSLAGVPNRLAVEGEELVVHRFPTGALGLASPDRSPARSWFSMARSARIPSRREPRLILRLFQLQAQCVASLQRLARGPLHGCNRCFDRVGLDGA
jgi:hypothetical protein